MKTRSEKVEAYTALPKLYDMLMEEVDYRAWCSYLMKLIAKNGSKEEIHHVLELGCGSGNLTIELLKAGYEVVGIDNSSAMLELAAQKTKDYGRQVILLEQDIRAMDFDIYEIDCVLAANDTFNYILEEEELKSVFAFIWERLKADGSFVFDMSSPHKLSDILGNNTFGESLEESCYLWENYYDKEEKLLTMDINIFTLLPVGTYERSVETQFQRAYEPDRIQMLLLEAGFDVVKMFSDFSEEESSEVQRKEAERIFFVCRK